MEQEEIMRIQESIAKAQDFQAKNQDLITLHSP